MKLLHHLTAAGLILAAATVFVTTSSRADEPASKGPTTAPSTQPINKMCAVEPEDEVDPKITTVYKGKVIGFCCDHCLPKFKKDPEKYMKNLKVD